VLNTNSNNSCGHIKAWAPRITNNKFIRKLLYRRFFRGIFGIIGPKYIIYEINGCKYYCNLLDQGGVVHYFLKNNHYEPYITKLMSEYTQSTGDVMDVGANIGYFSILCSKNTNGKVYSMEPEPTNYRDIVENIRLNASNNILPFNLAAGNLNEKINFYVNNKNSGDHRCSKLDDNLYKVIQVDMKRIDNVLTKEEFDNIRLIKIDVQGYEMKVCEGMAKYLKGSKDLKIISELEPKGMLKVGDEPAQYLQFMQDNGFKISIIDEEKRILIPASIEETISWSRKSQTSNILFEK